MRECNVGDAPEGVFRLHRDLEACGGRKMGDFSTDVSTILPPPVPSYQLLSGLCFPGPSPPSAPPPMRKSVARAPRSPQPRPGLAPAPGWRCRGWICPRSRGRGEDGVLAGKRPWEGRDQRWASSCGPNSSRGWEWLFGARGSLESHGRVKGQVLGVPTHYLGPSGE